MQRSNKDKREVKIKGKALLLTNTRRSVCCQPLGKVIVSSSIAWADAGVSRSPPESVVSLAAEWMQSQKKKQIWQIIANRSILAVRVVLEISSALETMNCCCSFGPW